MTKQAGHEEAIRLAIEKLKTIDLNDRCLLLGFNLIENGILKIRMFGGDYRLHIDDFRMVYAEDMNPIKQNDLIILLHYLLCDVPIKVTNEFITFRIYVKNSMNVKYYEFRSFQKFTAGFPGVFNSGYQSRIREIRSPQTE